MASRRPRSDRGPRRGGSPGVPDAQRRDRCGRRARRVCSPDTRADGQQSHPSPGSQGRRQPGLAGSRGQEGHQGTGDDHDRRVLQGRSRAVEFPHDRADAHHLRLLPTVHEAAGRPARQGDRPQGAPVWQPQRHGQGARHRARLAGRDRRQGTRHGGTSVPGRPGEQPRPDVRREPGRQDVQGVAEGHHLRRAEGRFPAPQHHDVQAHGGRPGAPRAGVLLGRRRVHRVEGLRAPEEGAAEVSVFDDEGTAGARRDRTSSRSRRS